MTRRVWLRSLVLSLFLLVPLASPAGAAEKTPSRQQDRGFVAWIWHAVAEIQKTLLPGIATKSDSRGTMDPDGLTSPHAGADSGPSMDPDGRS
ncbi:MAG TPA: hypothetical protein VGQ28_01280 [Thermoanaerobaculia bacterium]|nr:hypothetical protein [Thermoanaerobaculia bacterium]